MFNIFKKQPVLKDFSFLKCDMHSHLLPSIDDGAKNEDNSLFLIQSMIELGFSQVYTTPHVMADLYPNTPEIIRGKEKIVQQLLEEKGIHTKINAAAEYLLDEGFEAKMNADELLSLPGNRVLVEMGFIAESPHLDMLLFRLQTKGYKPVLAHPERYIYYHQNFNKYHQLKERGIELQLNLLSLTGYYGKNVLGAAQRLLKESLIDFLGTDLHHEQHLEGLRSMLNNRKIAKQLLQGDWKNEELMTI